MRISVFATTAWLSILGISHAADAPAGIRKQTNIPAQELGSALRYVAQDRELYVIFASQDVDRLRTAGVTGALTRDEMFQQLLDGSGLTYRFIDDKTVTILPIAAAQAADQPSRNPAAPPASPAKEAQKTHSFWDRFRVAQADSGNDVADRPGVAPESSESSSTAKVEEVIVTAQRREQRLLDTPISIGVLSGAELDRTSSRGVSDVLNQIGGVSLFEVTPGRSQISVRGVAPDQYVGAAAVGYYLDEVPFAFINFADIPDANAFDLSRVEVLRGSQGTLYGANALSGVVRVLTNDADLNDFEANGRIRGSNTAHGSENYGGDVAINVPVIPGELALRAVASYSDVSGYIDSTGALVGMPPVKEINDTKAQAYRFKVGYQPSENLTFKFGYSRSQIESGAPARADSDNLTTGLPADQRNDRLYNTYNLITEYRWPTMSLLSSTSYLDYSVDYLPVTYFASIDFVLSYFEHFGLNSFAQEFRLTSSLPGPWKWSAGALYKDTVQRDIQIADVFFTFPYQVRDESQSYAVFGELTRSLADGRFEITGGLRYFNDDLATTQQSDFVGGTTAVAPRQGARFDHVTGRVVAAYKPQQNRMFYGSVATGFRSGLNQSAAVALTVPNLPSLKPDSLITYEVGAKGASSDGAVSYEAALYYTDWEDVQQSYVLPNGYLANQNAGNVSGPGIDASLAYQPTRALTLHVGAGWNDLKFNQNIHTDPNDDSTAVLYPKNGRVNHSPKFSASAGGRYRMATPAAGMRLVLATNYTYRSPLVLRYLTGTTITTEQSGILRNWNASLGLEADQWSATLYGDNLLDSRDPVDPPNITVANGSVRQRPRTVGLQVTFKY